MSKTITKEGSLFLVGVSLDEKELLHEIGRMVLNGDATNLNRFSDDKVWYQCKRKPLV
jgi:hypothetical protein